MFKNIDFIFENPSKMFDCDDFTFYKDKQPDRLLFFCLENFQVVVTLDSRYKIPKYLLKYRGFDSADRRKWNSWQIYNSYDCYDEARKGFKRFLNEFVSRHDFFFNGFDEVKKNVVPF